jgi:GNAT superfamily N-acetyltransferase
MRFEGRFQLLVRSCTIPKVDELQVWSIVCFKIRTGYRRMGVAKALLKGAIDFARTTGVPALEAYPIDPDGICIDVNRILETDARSAGRPRILMRLDLRR